MPSKLKQFFTQNRPLISVVVAGVVLILIVLGGITLFQGSEDQSDPTEPNSANTNNDGGDPDRIPFPDFDPSPTAGMNMLDYKDSRLPFSFQYPEGWELSVEYSADREYYFDSIILTNSVGDFKVYIDSKIVPNPDSPEAENFVSPPPGGNPYRIFTREYAKEDFSVIASLNGKVLVLSETGGVDQRVNEQVNRTQLFASSFIPGESESVYEVRNGELTERLSFVRGDDDSALANEITIEYEVIGVSPAVAWVAYREMLVDIVKSIETANSADLP